MHDNHRLTPARIGKAVRLITAKAYRQAKADAEGSLVLQWRGPKLSGDIALSARAYFPDARKRDAGNYRKLITDALSGIAYTDDSQLARETWERAGIDRDNPRVDLTITRYLP